MELSLAKANLQEKNIDSLEKSELKYKKHFQRNKIKIIMKLTYFTKIMQHFSFFFFKSKSFILTFNAIYLEMMQEKMEVLFLKYIYMQPFQTYIPHMHLP